MYISQQHYEKYIVFEQVINGLPEVKAGSYSMDRGSSRPLPPTVPPATLPLRFSGLHAAVQMETKPTNLDAPFHREVPGGTRLNEPLR